MKDMILIRAKSKDGPVIRSVQEWYELAPPKKPIIQWRDFHSAKELARAWLRDSSPGMPSEYSKLLRSHALTRRFEPETVIAEMEIPIDDFIGPRNSDLVVIGTLGSLGQIIVACSAMWRSANAARLLPAISYPQRP